MPYPVSEYLWRGENLSAVCLFYLPITISIFCYLIDIDVFTMTIATISWIYASWYTLYRLNVYIYLNSRCPYEKFNKYCPFIHFTPHLAMYVYCLCVFANNNLKKKKKRNSLFVFVPRIIIGCRVSMLLLLCMFYYVIFLSPFPHQISWRNISNQIN